MASYIFYSEGIEISIDADADLLEWIRVHLEPFNSQNVAGAVKWKISCDRDNPIWKSEGLVVDIASPLGEPEREYWILPDTQHICVVRPAEAQWVCQHIIRLVRGLARNGAKHNHIFVHASMVQIGNHSLAFMGDRKSGKTTSMLNMLKNFQAGFVSNDDLSFKVISGNVVGYAWPRAISIRRETLIALHLDISQLEIAETTHPANNTGLVESYFFCYPEELCTFFQVPMLTRASVNTIIFPEFSDKASLLKLSEDQLFDRLSKNILSEVNLYSHAIDSMFPLKLDPSDLADKLKFISKHTQAYVLKQSFNCMEDVVPLIQKEIISGL